MAIVANWEFNGNRNDSSGGGMNLSATGTLQDKQGLNGNINCNNQRPSASVSSLFNTISSNISHIMWITNNNPSQTNKYCWLKKPTSGQDAILYGYVANTYETFSDRYGRFTIKNIGSDTKVHQIGFSYDGSNTRCYYDGVLISTNSQSGGALSTGGTFYLGGSDAGDAVASADYDGVIFDNTKLSDASFKNNYAFRKGFI